MDKDVFKSTEDFEKLEDLVWVVVERQNISKVVLGHLLGWSNQFKLMLLNDFIKGNRKLRTNNTGYSRLEASKQRETVGE